MYNGNYLRLFEIGRTELMRSFGMPYSDVEAKGYQLPLLEANIQFYSPARYDDIIVIESKYTKNLDTAKHSFEYELTCNSTKIASGRTSHIFVKSESFKPCRTPKFFREKFAK
ncbi:MAG: thioesterase family protein [Candidatus Kapaibacteriales bacterium]